LIAKETLRKTRSTEKCSSVHENSTTTTAMIFEVFPFMCSY